MVCDRCIMAVKFELMKFGIVPLYVSLGEIEIENELTEFQYQQLTLIFQLYGFEILDKNQTQVFDKLKKIVIELLNDSKNNTRKYNSIYIEQRIGIDYAYVNNLFSEIKSMSIEQFIALQKVEKVKGLLEYNECKMAEIADKLGYSSVSYLSTQFKKLTGFTPNYFKNIKNKKKLMLASVLTHQEYDFSIINKSNARTIAKIKNIVIELVNALNETKKINFSEYIERKLKVKYKYLDKLFSEIEEVTIEQYIMVQKIEKAKELIVYKEFSANIIANMLGYSSIADLSSYLKTVTGLTINYFENIKYKKHLLQNKFKTTNNTKRIRKSIRIKM